MRNLAVINCLSLSAYAQEPLGSGSSPLERVLDYAGRLAGCERIMALVDEENEPALPASVEVIPSGNTPEALFAALASLAGDCDSLFYIYGDTPFLDPRLAERMWENHRRYQADYTFADAYPLGLAPEILRASALGPLAQLAQGETGPITRDTLFEVLKKDINAFEIETEIPPVDLRLLRIRLAAENRAGFMLLERLTKSGLRESGEILIYLQDHQEILRTLPNYFSIQLTGGCPQSCSYCPYPQIGGDILKRRDALPLDKLRKILKEIDSFSGSGYINFSPWGEPALHPEIESCIEAVLAYPQLKCLIETAGIGWDPAIPARLAEKAGGRLTWIVSLDAETEATYRKLRGEGFAEAREFARRLLSLYPEQAFVQAVRMEHNEQELEGFYRNWKEVTENIIIQKYDHFSGRLPQLRVADVSPLKRDACWHVKRDMTILINGDVPLCREDLELEHSLGNIFEESLAVIWERGEEYYIKHLSQDYPPICRECDEYYTFNF